MLLTFLLVYLIACFLLITPMTESFKNKKEKKIPKGKYVSNKTELADFWITIFISWGFLEDSLYVSCTTLFFPKSHMETITAYNCALINQGILEIMIVIMNLRIISTPLTLVYLVTNILWNHTKSLSCFSHSDGFRKVSILQNAT